MNDELSATPKYRVTGDKWLDTGTGMAAPPGSIFESKGWPKSDWLEPQNESAKRVFAYWRQNHTAPSSAYPPTPWSEKLGRICLPDLTGRDWVNVVPEGDVIPTMPAYQTVASVTEASWLPQVFRDPPRAGDVIHVLSWPERLFAVGRFKPANDAARAVVSYFELAREHPLLPHSPWDWYLREVYLPELPPTKHWGREHIAVRPMPLKQTVIRGRPHSGARRPVVDA